jgi:hypothetical protein
MRGETGLAGTAAEEGEVTPIAMDGERRKSWFGRLLGQGRKGKIRLDDDDPNEPEGGDGD